MATSSFDLGELFRAVDSRRRTEGLSWVLLSERVGVSTSTIRRWAVADDAEADGVLALVRWLGVAPEDFVANSSVASKPFEEVEHGFIRVDMASVDGAAGRPVGRRPRTRTSIQNLVEVAEHAGLPVAALTRWSEI